MDNKKKRERDLLKLRNRFLEEIYSYPNPSEKSLGHDEAYLEAAGIVNDMLNGIKYEVD